MPNLGKSQAQWTDHLREFLQYVRPARIFRSVAERFSLARVAVLEEFDVTAKLLDWTFSNPKRGDNVNEDGRVFITVTDETPGAGQAQVDVYEDSAKTSLVARGRGGDGESTTPV